MKIIFQGDSITDAGRDRILPQYLGNGYVSMLSIMFTEQGAKHELRNTAVGGNRICDIYARWKEDALNHEFDVLSILCGINDVGLQFRENRGVSTHDYRVIYDRMLYEAKEKNKDAKFVLLEPFVFKIDLSDINVFNQNDIFLNYDLWYNGVTEKAQVVKELSGEYDAVFVPLVSAFEEYIKEHKVEDLTNDGIHPTIKGHRIIAQQWMKYCKDIIK